MGSDSSKVTHLLCVEFDSSGQDRRVDLGLDETQIGHGAVDVLVAHGALRLDEIVVELLIDPIGKGLAHGMGTDFARELIGHHGLMTPGGGKTDRYIECSTRE